MLEEEYKRLNISGQGNQGVQPERKVVIPSPGSAFSPPSIKMFEPPRKKVKFNSEETSIIPETLAFRTP